MHNTIYFRNNKKRDEYKIKIYEKIESRERALMKNIRKQVFDMYSNGYFLCCTIVNYVNYVNYNHYY